MNLVAVAGLLAAAGLAACTPGDEGAPEPGLPVELAPEPYAAPERAAPSPAPLLGLRGVRDVVVSATGATWAELTWTSVAGPDGYGVWLAYSAPATLLAEAGMPGEEHWPDPSAVSIEWAVIGEDSHVMGSIFVQTVSVGTCAFPVAARSPGEVMSCRVEDLLPDTPFLFFVRPFHLEDAMRRPTKADPFAAS